jgi:hypothetical protein
MGECKLKKSRYLSDLFTSFLFPFSLPPIIPVQPSPFPHTPIRFRNKTHVIKKTERTKSEVKNGCESDSSFVICEAGTSWEKAVCWKVWRELSKDCRAQYYFFIETYRWKKSEYVYGSYITSLLSPWLCIRVEISKEKTTHITVVFLKKKHLIR